MKAPGFLAELLTVLFGSMLAGFLIGTLQHYVAFGLWGDGFGIEPFEFALFEGGIVGAAFAVPTGLIAYYAVLKRRVTIQQIAIILVGSLVGGCGAGTAISWLSAFITPFLAVGMAVAVKQFSSGRPSSHPSPDPSVALADSDARYSESRKMK
ncbi:MAG TPA: hypothetical protein VKT50_08890 [Candidatus Acidoferrales bacterium]|nr:hypothetical protein [Candidatus Acidoferrales bacterium]